MAKAHRIIICVVLAVVLVPLAYVGACSVKAKRYERGYAQVGVGDTKRDVTQLLGEPSEVERCYSGEGCAEVYVYNSFMERWGFVLDGDGKVVHKYYNVSY
jgi:hypothetical protein